MCHLGFTGYFCETNINLCSSNPCLFNSSCLDHYSSFDKFEYKCICKNGYEGKNCQNKINKCVDKDCSNNGLCITDIESNESVCKCVLYYSGANCEIKSQNLIEIEYKIKITVIIAIIVLSLLFITLVLNDLINYFLKLKPKDFVKKNIKILFKNI
jgi:hypothetical protein